MGVLAYCLRQAHLAVLVCAYLIAVLLVMDGKTVYLGLTLLP
jgi:hypothetical protein